MELDRMINHAILKPRATEAAIQKIVDETKGYNSFSACINPCWVVFANEQLADTDVAVCTVIDFPLKVNAPEVKAYETADAVKNGVNEVDMVINIGALKSRQYDYVRQDIQGVVNVARGKALVKMVIETALLTDEEEVRACESAKETDVDFVKTSTGFSTGSAEVAGIRLMHETVGPDMGIKASGSVHNAEGALAMVEAGAAHIGASTGVAVVSGTTSEGY